jgi:2-polyprenyl-3-methyl-5-hydroxy-6-metoxy-1,4-benzoquinol methylase
METTAIGVIDEAKIEAFVGQIVSEVGATVNAALVVIGDKLGLWRAMADGRPVTPAGLAARTGTNERYVREWLSAQAAGGYVTYHPDGGQFSLPVEHALALADETSPVFLAGAFQTATAVLRAQDALVERFRTGAGFGWHEHDEGLFDGCERHFGTLYRAQLVDGWLPALDGVVERLAAGGRVADVGCGHGASTVLMAKAFPAATFVGYDYHAASVATAQARAKAAGVDDRVTFEVATAAQFPGTGFDLVTVFDALHDMGDPEAAATRLRESLAPDGVCMIVEPAAADDVAGNLQPRGRFANAISTMVCTPASLSQPGRRALGTQAGPARITQVLHRAGFSRVRPAVTTPFNIVFEARP